MSTFKYIHSTSSLSVLGVGDKKLKDLVITDKILVSKKDNINICDLVPIKSISTEQHNIWYKIQYTTEESFIFDRTSLVYLNKLYLFKDIDRFKSLENTFFDEQTYQLDFKEYNKLSLDYIIEIEGDYDILYINGVAIYNGLL